MLTVLQVAYPFAPVGPDTAGGSEQIVFGLDRALTEQGHRSIVIACEGSQVAGTLVATPRPAAGLDDGARAAGHADHRRAIGAALRRWPVDVIHLHGIDFDAYLPPAGVAALVTLHLPLAWYSQTALRPRRAETWLVCVSRSQRGAGPDDLPLLSDIPNGVDLEQFAARHAKRRFALALGRICPEKGFHLALDAARAAGTALLLAGEVFAYAEHRAYFRDLIEPRLDRWRRFIGPVGLARKRRLPAAARCGLIPSLVAETGSLVAMEALASGTPVIAFPNGALADVVEDGVTGFHVRDAWEMAAAIRAVDSLDSAACRASARARFSVRPMIENYLGLYHRLASRRADVA